MKQKLSVLSIVLAFLLMFSACDLLEETELSEEDIVNGLKTALEMGTDTACTDLNMQDGYYGNKLVKILLPPEADVIFEALDNPTIQSLGIDVLLEEKIEDVVLTINRAAEDVAQEAKPIFINAITTMTITDGMNILSGVNTFSSSKDSMAFDSLAATHYMEYMTRDELFGLYQPKIDTALSQDLGLGFSANEAWNTLITYYNGYACALIGSLTPVEEIVLPDYCADKGLDGLFYFVGNQEKAIRDDPYAWASDIIEKVFGYVYED